MMSSRLIKKAIAVAELARGVQPESYLNSEYVRYIPGKNGMPIILYFATTYDYGVRRFGLSYEELNFYASFLSLGYGLIKCDSASLVKKLGRRGAMDVLDCAVNFYNPDYVFMVFFKDDYITSKLEKIRVSSRAPFIGWFSDDHWRYESLSKDVGRSLDLCVTTAVDAIPRYKEDGISAHLSQWAFNPYIYRDLYMERDIDVCFIGQNYGNRAEVVKKLRSRGLRVEVRGRGWPEGRISFPEAVRLLNRAKIALNLSGASAGDRVQVKGRDFEVIPCGALLVTEGGTGIENYFSPNKEIATYANLDEISSVVSAAVHNDAWRKELVCNAKARAIEEHTWESRFKKILSAAKKRQ